MKKCLLVLFAWICCLFIQLTPTKAQTLEQTFEHAIEQFELQHYTAATMAFQRVIFFDSLNVYPTAYKFLADCYLAQKKYHKAAQNFDIIASYQTDNDSLRTELIFDKCNALLLQQKYNLALIELLSLENDPSFEAKKNLYFGVAFFGLEDYETSQEHFKDVSTDSIYQNTIDSLFQKNQKVTKLNPQTASYLSIALPGLGQFYSGDVKNGINSLALNALLLSAFVLTVTNTGLLNGILVVYPWYQRYFIGGFEAARHNTVLIKQERHAAIYQMLLKTVDSVMPPNN